MRSRTHHLPSGDYVSPNLEFVKPDDAFPNLTIGHTASNDWPHLRRESGHNWYVDRRNPSVGFVSRDEASIIYNTARMFAERPCLEIGCWRGWSTVHIALGSRHVDVIDPVLEDPSFRSDVEATLERAGVSERVNLYPLSSPDGVHAVAAGYGRTWSFAFIDGDHTGDAPLLDVEAVHQFAAEDSIILLHDLLAPEPAAALERLRALGWSTAVYLTMQCMGVATRGRCLPVEHVPDPSRHWALPAHLASFAVIGESHRSTATRLRLILGTGAPEPTAFIANDDERTVKTTLELSGALGAAAAMQEKCVGLQRSAERLSESAEAGSRFDELHKQYMVLVAALADAKSTQHTLECTLAAEREAKLRAIADADRARAEQQRLAALLDPGTGSVVVANSRVLGTPQLAGVHDARLEKLSTDNRELRIVAGWYATRYETQRAVDAFATAVCRPRVLLGLARRGLARRHEEVRQVLADAFLANGGRLPLPEDALVWLSKPRTLIGLLRRLLLSGASAARGTLAGSLRAHQLVCDDREMIRRQTGVAGEFRPGIGDLAAEPKTEQARLATAEQKIRALERQLEEEERELSDLYVELAGMKRRVARSAASMAVGCEGNEK